MATPTYDLIDSEILSSSASSVTFTSIPGTYRDLVLVANFKPDTGTMYGAWILNSDTGSNYSRVRITGNGSTASSTSATAASGFLNSGSAWDTTDFGLAKLEILDYSATDKHKTALLRSNMADLEVEATVFRWASTSAVTSITLDDSNGNNFAAGSTFYLYGIAS